jgi:plastocyanin
MTSRPRPTAAEPATTTGTTSADAWCRRHVVLVVATVGLVVVTGCGGGQAAPGTSSPEEGVVQVVGTDDLRFDPASVQAPAGTELELVCAPAVNHNLVIVETGQEITRCPPGGTDRGTLDLAPDVYTYLCTVPGHSATMRGELTITGTVTG